MHAVVSHRSEICHRLARASAQETRKQFRNIAAGLAWTGVVILGLVALDSLFASTPHSAPNPARALGSLAPSLSAIGTTVGHDGPGESVTYEQGAVPHVGIAGETAIARALDHDKWRSMLARHEAALLAAAPNGPRGSSESSAVAEWHALIGGIRALDRRQQAQRVQAFFNRFKHTSDARLWKSRDYWASPIEMMTIGAGDCEDIAIAKFLALRAAGVDESDLRLLVVADTRRDGTPHAVVTVNRYEGVPHGKLVLDNLRTDVGGDDALKPYKPIYALNGTAFYAYGLDALRYAREP